jgi:hypothetical protein
MHSVFATNFGRVYGINGGYYPSVTTVLNGFNPNCQEFSNDYAVLGTRCHYEILGLYRELDKPDSYYSRFSEKEVNEKLDRANDMWQTVDIGDVIDVEMAVYNDTVGYAGSLDMLTKIQQKTTLVDLKTGNYYAKYPLQIAAYALACPQPVEQALIVRLDLNLDRNPESLVDMIWYTREQLDEYEIKFCAKAKKYHEDQQAYIDAMSY